MSSVSSRAIYDRELSRALENQNASKLLFHVAKNFHLVASEVVRIKCGSVSDVQFHVNGQLLLKILDRVAQDATQHDIGDLTAAVPQNVKRYIAQFPDRIWNNPQSVNFMELATKLQNEFREFSGRFKKVDLPKPVSDYSCYDFAIFCAGFQVSQIKEFIITSNHGDFSAPSRIKFLQSQGFKDAKTPLQKGDLIFFMDANDSLLHAAIASDDKGTVYSKFGNANPYYYVHRLDDTPIEYGTKFRVLRKSE